MYTIPTSNIGKQNNNNVYRLLHVSNTLIDIMTKEIDNLNWIDAYNIFDKELDERLIKIGIYKIYKRKEIVSYLQNLMISLHIFFRSE